MSPSAIIAYLEGNRTLFNDFSAAKDAFDLEHPEVWYAPPQKDFPDVQSWIRKNHLQQGTERGFDLRPGLHAGGYQPFRVPRS